MATGQFRMDIGGMTCAHCEVQVRQALERAGAQETQVDARRGDATFTLRDGRSNANLQRAVREAGYQPGLVDRRRLVEKHLPNRPGTHDYDLAIIGSGSAAFAAAIAAREQGARVAMIERGAVGGTCVNIGCVPSKLLLRAAETFYHADNHPYEGVETKGVSADYGAMIAQKNRLTAHMRQEKYLDLIGTYGWELITGEARFVNEETLQVGERTLSAGAYLIATGTLPTIPPIPGLKEAGSLTSTTAMELDRLPASLAVIGAGYVALELGQVFRHLGTDVTIMQRGPRLLPDYEPEVAEAVERSLNRLGTRVLTGTTVQQVERTNAGRRLITTQDGRAEMIETEEILVATGRQPNVEALNLPAAGVAIDARGAPVVDASLRTTNSRIFAAGDVTLGPQFVYVAAYEGKLAAGNALNGAAGTVDLTAVPSVIFTEPQVATVGLTRAAAEAAGYQVVSSSLPIKTIARAQVNFEADGVYTLVAEAETGRVLGVQIVGSNAGEVIYAATLAVKHRLTIQDLEESLAPYLTMAEGLKLGAVAFERDVTKLSCCA